MLSRWKYTVGGQRDLRIDWLRGLAMACVIIDHSRLASLLSWFSYERFWVVTAAEVFVVLSGIVLGMVYGPKLVKNGWLVVARGLGRRALILYAAFLAVALSVLLISLAGIDVRSITSWDGSEAGFVWFLSPRTLDAASWRDVLLMRWGPWPFLIVGLYVWLVVAAVPCLMALRFVGWRPLLALSWAVYLWFRIVPHPLTTGLFETTFPILAWQLLFVHGVAIGYHRERLSAFVARCPKIVPIAVAGASAAFIVLALCNPWLAGPSWLHWGIVSPERFAYLYETYFNLSELHMGRVLNLAVALPVGYMVLTWCWGIVRPLGVVFVTLGQQSLGAFVLHVYAILLIAQTPLGEAEAFWINTLVQVVMIVGIAALLTGIQRLTRRRRVPAGNGLAQPLAA